MGSIESTLNAAKEQGLILREETEKLYNELKKEMEQKNEAELQNTTTADKTPVQVVTPPAQESQKPNNYDPNLDPNYGMADEQPLVMSSKIGYYVEDSKLEDAFSSTVSGPTKTK